MTSDFVVNLLAGLTLVACGAGARRLLTILTTQSTRRLWRVSRTKTVLTIAGTNYPAASPSSSVRTSLSEMRILLELIPTLLKLSIPYQLTESTMRATTALTRCDLLLIGGLQVNEITRIAMELLQRRLGFVVEALSQGEAGAFAINGQRFATQYSQDGHAIDLDYGVLLRVPNPFSSDSKRSAILVLGSHGVGTSGAAQVLIDDHLAKLLLRKIASKYFLAVVSARPTGGAPVVEIVHVLELRDTL